MDTEPLGYTVSIHYDRRLYKQDVAGSIAHAKMLANQGIIPKEEASAICQGLASIQEEIDTDAFPWRSDLEDLHMNIEARLIEKVGPLGGKLHTGRSRNDQVALDMRMYAKEACKKTLTGIKRLQRALIDLAEKQKDLIMPGYTHLQRAQPVLFGHHILAYFEMLRRDHRLFGQCYDVADVLPLGSGALAGVAYPIDRDFVARELGFSQTSANSMDAVSDRDYLVQYHCAAAICMMHLSRLSEELILWSSWEFGFVTLDPRFTTGSSMMPQKRNPDFAELARGKTGRVYGHLTSILTTLKGLPLAYNRDLQEDKEGFFDTSDTLDATLEVFAGIIDTITINRDRIEEAAGTGHILATDLADYLVGRGLTFREAHGVLKEISDYARTQSIEIHQLSLEEYHRFSPIFDEKVLTISVRESVKARDVAGGTAPPRVEKALLQARKRLEMDSDA